MVADGATPWGRGRSGDCELARIKRDKKEVCKHPASFV